jgi:hypothetical protein
VKRRRTFVELRPKQKWVELSIMLTRPIDDPRVSGASSWHAGGTPTSSGCAPPMTSTTTCASC